MSVTFFIGPYKPIEWKTARSDLKIDPQEYRNRLLKRWPDIKLHTEPSSHYLIEWSIPSENGTLLMGGLQRDQQIVSLGRGPNYIDFILWHRTFVPDSYQLFLFRSDSWEALELKMDTDREEIENFKV